MIVVHNLKGVYNERLTCLKSAVDLRISRTHTKGTGQKMEDGVLQNYWGHAKS